MCALFIIPVTKPGQNSVSRFRPFLHSIVNTAIMRALAVHCWRKDHVARERNGHSPSCVEDMKMKLLMASWLPPKGLIFF